MNSMRKYVILAGILPVLALCTLQMAHGQQQPVFSQYPLNKFLYNPALAGVDGITTIGLTARQQWSGLPNPPSTFAFTAQTRVLEDSYIMRLLTARKNPEKASRRGRIGLGVNMYSDHNGAISRSGFQFTYAYHINWNDKAQLSFGLSAAGFQFKLNDKDAVILDQDDPLLLNNRHSFFVPDFNFGTYLLTDQFYAGIGISDLLGSYLKLGRYKFENYRTLRHYYVMSGYRFYAGDNFRIEPSFLLRTTREEIQCDFNLTSTYQRTYWLGFSYRTGNTFVFMGGLNIQNFFLGYAYDAGGGYIKRYTTGSHELMFGMRFGESSVRRMRWLRKDVKSFEDR